MALTVTNVSPQSIVTQVFIGGELREITIAPREEVVCERLAPLGEVHRSGGRLHTTPPVALELSVAPEPEVALSASEAPALEDPSSTRPRKIR